MDTLGVKILKLRKMAGYSQEKLADLIGVSRQTVCKWETNIVQPNSENIMILCKTFNVDKEYFYNECLNVEEINANDEIAVSSLRNRLSIKLVFGLICVSILLVIFILATIISGFMTLTTNKGDAYEVSINFDYGIFVLFLILSIVSLIGEIILITLILKKKYVSKHNVNIL